MRTYCALAPVPPFSVGVVVFDNWLLHYANTRASTLGDVLVVDASLVALSGGVVC
jgi:hypothetical protein